MLRLWLLSGMLASAAAADTGAPLLWRLDREPPAWLLGTIHLADPRVLALPDAAESAFTEADAVYTEIPLDVATQAHAATGALLPPGQDLESVLGPELIGRIDGYLGGIAPGLSIGPLKQLKVWALALSLQLFETRLKQPGTPLDISLYRRAETAGKAVGGLETAAEQIAMFDGLSLQEQRAMLVGTLDYLESARADRTDMVEELVAAYLSGDLEQLAARMNEYLDTRPGQSEMLFDRFIASRNRLMAKRIDELVKSQPGTAFLFAVGAGHLWGDSGLPALLRDMGHTVARTGP